MRSISGRLGDGGGHLGGDGFYICLVHVLEAVQVGQGPVQALLPDLAVGGVLHTLDVPVNLLALDARQVVAHRHIEHEAVRIAQAQLLGQQFAGPPGFDILGIGLGHGELGGPLAVVALVPGGDAGLVDALGQLLPVHDLDGFQLKEPGPGCVGGDDVLGQLGVGPGGGAIGGLNLLRENGQGFVTGVLHQLGYAENTALVFVLGERPVHQLGERHGPHDIAHFDYLHLYHSQFWSYVLFSLP